MKGDGAVALNPEISGENGAFELRLGPEPHRCALTLYSRYTFPYQVDLEPPAPLTGATFVIAPNDLAQAIILDYVAGNGQQLFPPVVATRASVPAWHTPSPRQSAQHQRWPCAINPTHGSF